MDFNYETGKASNITATTLLKWISDLHSELSDGGFLPGAVSDETHQQIMILASQSD